MVGKKEKKEEYLAKFSDAFAQNGLNRTPVKKLSEAAGINEASIYQYFSNKDEIVIECVKQYFADVQEELFPIMTNSLLQLDQRMQRVLLYHAQLEQREKFIVQVLTDPTYQKKCVPILRDFMVMIREMASCLSSETEIPENVLHPMVLMVMSMLIFHSIFNSTDSMLVQVDYIEELFSEELKKARHSVPPPPEA